MLFIRYRLYPFRLEMPLVVMRARFSQALTMSEELLAANRACTRDKHD
jgi:hypothetical protein